MKKFLVLVAAVTVTNCSTIKSYSYDRTGAKIFKAMDHNHDGFVSLRELENYQKAKFDKIDTNHDCKITRAEAKAVGREANFNKIGKSHLTCKGEVAAEKALFKKVDLNHDKKVSAEEYKKHYLAAN